MKFDIKIYGIEERSENILHNKEILGLSDNDVFITKREDRKTPLDKWPYKACKNAFTQPIPEGITHRIVLQDDVELAPNFKDYIQKVITARPNDIFMLTALDFREEIDYVKQLKSPYVAVGQFVSGCALLIPVKYINNIFTWFEKTYPQIWIGNPHEDTAFKFYCMQHGINCSTTIPSLVQHLGDTSSICNYETPMRTYYFSDWDKVNWTNNYLNPAYINKEKFKEYLIKERSISKDDSVHYFVRTTGERNFDYYPLKTISLYDYYHKPIDSFIGQLESINKYNSVLMEDDLILCKNFQEEIEKVIAQYPNYIIQFFTDPGIYESTFLRSWPFEWNQCTYYPKGVPAKIAKAMKTLRDKFPPNQRKYSQIENAALISLKIPHIIYRPCLVQHNDMSSILQSDDKMWTSFRHDTIWFKDYLDEAGLEYYEAYTPENVKKLTDIRNKHVAQLVKEYKEGK